MYLFIPKSLPGMWGPRGQEQGVFALRTLTVPGTDRRSE